MSRIRVESPTPVNPPAPITTSIQPLTRTPSKRRRERGLSNALAHNADSTNSAVTKKVTTPRRPTVSCRLSLKQVEAAQKQEWEAEWYEWVVGHLWVKEKNFKHAPGTTTIYRRNGEPSLSLLSKNCTREILIDGFGSYEFLLRQPRRAGHSALPRIP